jgi:hypothetical protein
MTSSCSKEIAGCTDPDSINYDATANVDDGSCQYQGQLVIWFEKNTSDFFLADGTTSLKFFLDGVLATTMPVTNYFALQPNCGDVNTATLTKNLGKEKAKNVTITIKAQDDFVYGSYELIAIANYCVSHRLVKEKKRK